MDVAALGFEVDSSKLKKANDELERTKVAASSSSAAIEKAEASWKKVGSAAEEASKAMAKGNSPGRGIYDRPVSPIDMTKMTPVVALIEKINREQSSLKVSAIETASAIAAESKVVVASSAANVVSIEAERAARVKAHTEYLAQVAAMQAARAKERADASAIAQRQFKAGSGMGGAKPPSDNDNFAASIIAAREITKETGKYSSSLVTQALRQKEAVESTLLLDKSMSLLKTSILGLVGVGVAFAATAVGAFGLYKFVEASIAAEKTASTLEATLAGVGKTSGQTVDSITKHASALEDLTTVGASEIVNASALMLTFDRIRGETFPRATTAILDLSQALGKDLDSATKLVAKSLNNPIKGIASLEAAGIKLNAAQQASIKSFMAQNNIAAAQGVILTELESRYKGAAEAMRGTLGGALKALGGAFGNLFELSSEQMDPLRMAVEGLITAVKDPAFVAFAKTVGEALFAGLTLAVKGVTLLAEGLAFLSKNADAVGVALGTAFILLAPNAIAAMITGIGALGTAFKALWALMLANPFVLLGTAIVALSVAVYTFRDDIKQAISVDVVEVVKSAGNIIVQAFMLAFEDVNFLWKNFGTVADAATKGVINGVVAMMNSVVATIAKGIDWLIDKVNQINPLDPISKFGVIEPIKGVPNPSADKLEQEVLRSSARRKDIKATDYIGEIGKALETNTPKAKAFAAALGGVNDEIDAKTGGKGKEDPYAKIIKGAEEFIAKQKAEAAGVGIAQDEALKLKYTTELLAKAQDAGINKMGELTAALTVYAGKMAAAETATNAAKQTFEALKGGKDFIQQQLDIQSTLGLSAEATARVKNEQVLLNQATKNGTPISAEQRAQLISTAAEMANVEARTKDLQETFAFARSTTQSFFKDMLVALREGKSVWEVFGNAVNKVLDKVLDKLASLATDALFDLVGGGSSGGGGGILAALGLGGTSTSKNATGSAGIGGTGSNSIFGAIKSGFSGIGTSLSTMWSQTANFFGIGGYQGAGQGADAIMGLSNGAGGLFGSGISGLSALGAGIGGISGIMQLMKGGTANTIGGIGSIVGAGVSLIPGIGQIAGPIISILSSVLPGLLGGGTPPTETSYGYDAIAYDPKSKGFGSSGGAWGPNYSSMNSSLGGLGQGINAILGSVGKGITDATKVWGVALESFSEKYGDGSSFSRQTSYAVDAQGRKTQIGMGSNEHDIGLEAAGITATIQSILGGAVGQISDSLKTALENFKRDGTTTMEGLAKAISFVTDIYDQFGKPALQTKAAFKDLETQFAAFQAQAEELGLSLTPVTEGLKKAKEDVAKDAMHNINAVLDPVGTAFADLAKEAAQTRAEMQYLIDSGMSGIVDMAKVDEFYLRKESALKETLFGVSTKQLQDAIDSMTVGVLSNATGTTKFNAAKVAFDKTLQDALAGNTDATARLVDEGTTLAAMGKDQYGSSSSYTALSKTIVDAFERVKEMIGQPVLTTSDPSTTSSSGQVSEELKLAYAQIARQNTIIADQQAQQAKLMAKLDKLADLMLRNALKSD